MAINNRGDLIFRGNKLKDDELKNKNYYRESVSKVYQPYINEKKRIENEKLSLFNSLIDDVGIEVLLDAELSKEFYSLCYDLYINNYDVSLYLERPRELFSGFPLVSFSGEFYNYDYSKDDAFINILTVYPNDIGMDSVTLETNFTLLENIYDKQLEITPDVYIKPVMEGFRGYYIIRRVSGEWRLIFKDFLGGEEVNFASGDSLIFWDFITTV